MDKSLKTRRCWRKVAVAGALVGLFGYAACCAVLATRQEALVFRPAGGSGATPAAHGLDFDDLRLLTPDGAELHAWYVPAPGNARTVLFLHGNAGRLSHRLHTLSVLHHLGHAVLALDYRGYGTSTGAPSERGLELDALTAWNWLTGAGGRAPGDIVVYGRSLGGAVAAQLAASVHPAGLVLESTFTRLADVAAARYPWAPVRWLLHIEFDSIAALSRVRCPVLVAHSPDDELIPYRQAAELAAAVRGGAARFELRGSHARAFRRGGRPYQARLQRFLAVLD